MESKNGKIMVLGDARTPQRFWTYKICVTPEEADELRAQGFVESVKNKSKGYGSEE